MFDITKACELQNSCTPVNYNKVVTGGNDPSITNAMRYSQYVRNSKPRTVYSSDAQLKNTIHKPVTIANPASVALNPASAATILPDYKNILE